MCLFWPFPYIVIISFQFLFTLFLSDVIDSSGDPLNLDTGPDAEVCPKVINDLIACPGFFRTTITINALYADDSCHRNMDYAQTTACCPWSVPQGLFRLLPRARKRYSSTVRKLWVCIINDSSPASLITLLPGQGSLKEDCYGQT